ncbi:MAG: carboxy-S-adenosyl-L-methionine synthase CmoA [Opitutaceae bacterium]|nr:carboxy-S-adenosyl-L-methionine synthase CmoA [Opitutaceae bacterium]|tara:strand:- start:562 stop:1290 length:729 start_codon:yes stop_codon:yes gene_type:complete
MKKDNIFVDAISEMRPFVFDEQVAEVFEDMIQRSVPGYEMSLSMIALIARLYARLETNVYDLGCSLGASSLALVSGNSLDGLRLVGVDNAEAMLLSCSKNLESANLQCEWDLICENITDTVIQNASIVVLNFTLQFIPLERRLQLLEKIYSGLVSGGVVLISEKIAFEEEGIQKSMTNLHEDFKRAHGYSDLEVSQKRTALENVLIPESITDHKSRLIKAGFSNCSRWFQCFNFASLIAFKD